MRLILLNLKEYLTTRWEIFAWSVLILFQYVMKDHENEMSHHHRDFVENALDICNNISAEASSQDKNTHGDHSVPLSGVKSELTESDFCGLCENSCTNAAENIFEKTHTHILDHDGSITFRSHQRKNGKYAALRHELFVSFLLYI
jgi:hypothetical protein